MNCKISSLTIRFDDNLFNFINTIKDKYDITRLNVYDLILLQRYQQDIRELFVKYKNLLTFNTPYDKINFTINNPKSYLVYPNTFALFICLISDLNKCTDWDTLLDQNTNKMELWDCDCDDNDDNILNNSTRFKCCCGHICQPMNLYQLTNKYTNHKIIIGCDCANKFQLINKDQLKILLKKREINKYYSKLMKENEIRLIQKKEQRIKTKKEKEERDKKILLNIISHWKNYIIYKKNIIYKYMQLWIDNALNGKIYTYKYIFVKSLYTNGFIPKKIQKFTKY